MNINKTGNVELIKEIDKVINDIVSNGRKPKFQEVVQTLELTKMFLLKNMDIRKYIVEKEIYYRNNPPEKLKLYFSKEQINEIVNKLSKENKEVSYRNIASELGVSVQKLYGIEVIKNAVVENRVPKYAKRIEEMLPKMEEHLKSMLEEGIPIASTEIANRMNTNYMYIYRHSELKDIVEKYKRKQTEKCNN